MNADIRRTLRSIFYSVSGSAVGHERWRPFLSDGETVLDTVFDPILDGLRPQQPSLFIGGTADPAREAFTPTYDRLESHLPILRKKVLLEGTARRKKSRKRSAACSWNSWQR
jgi:hypothetical protein